jgi:hypothetical protein
MRRRIAPFYFFLAVLQSSRLCYALLNPPSRWQYGNDLVVQVWRCGGGSGAQTAPSHSTSPFGYPIQHGQLFDTSFSSVFSHPICCCALTGLPSVIVFFPPERSFLAYAFPLLDMCNLRLTYLYLSFFSHLCSVHPCALIPLAYDHHHHHHHHLLFVFIYLEEKTNEPTYFRLVLSCVNTLMCIACFG